MKFRRSFQGRSAGKESTCNAGDLSSIPGSGRSTGEGIGYPLQYSWAFTSGSEGKKCTCNVGHLGSIPGLGRSPGGGHGNTFQYSYLENPKGKRSLAGYSPQGSQRVRPNCATQHSTQHTEYRVLPWWLSDKESACQCRRHKRCGFGPWVGKILWRRKFQPTPASLPRKYYTMDRGAWGVPVHGVTKELHVTETNSCNGA